MNTQADTHVDPVCGMTVDPEKAAGTVEFAGTSYYFCGKSCVAKFRASPGQFLKPAEPQVTEAPGVAQVEGGLAPQWR